MSETIFERQQLFTPLTQGYYCYRIPALIRTLKGTLIAFCEARQHSCSDWGHSAIMAKRCEDPLHHMDAWQEQFIVKESAVMIAPRNDIETFTAQKLAEKFGWNQEKDYLPRIPVVTNNPVPIVDGQTGQIHLIYCEDYHQAYYTQSSDDGKTWSDSIEITAVLEQIHLQYDWTVIASGPGQGLQLQHGEHKGRLIVPFWMACNPDDITAHHPSQVATIYSDDYGETWQAGEFVPFTVKDPNESKIIQLADGSVLMVSRTNQPLDVDDPQFNKAYSISPDGISRWREYQFGEVLPEPRCMGSLACLGSHLLYSSPDPTAVGGNFDERKNLTLWLSSDEGQTWPIKKSIDKNASAYSDLAIDETTEIIYVMYECNYSEGDYDRAGGMDVVKFNLDWLLNP